MPDIQYFQGGFEEEKHDRALFGLLGGHDEVHIHFNANGCAPARDVWEQHSEILGGLLAHSHDLHVHQNAGPGGGETDIREHDGAILGGLVLDDRHSDFKTQRVTAAGIETKETHDSSGSSVGGMLAEGHRCSETTSVQGADGVTHTESKTEGGGSILGGVIGAGQDKSESSSVTTPDGHTLVTHYKSDSSGEALCGAAAEGQCHTEYVDNGQGPIGVSTYRGSVLGGVIYAGDYGRVYGADLPGAQNYLEVPSAYPASGAPTPIDVSESSYTNPAALPPSDSVSPAPAAPAPEVSQAPAPVVVPSSESGNANVVPAKPVTGGDLSKDGAMGAAHPQVVQNFNDPDTNQPIARANVLRFDNGDYFLADGSNVRLIDAGNQRVNFLQEGPVAVAQSANRDDMVTDQSGKSVPRVEAQISPDGQGVKFDFFSGLSVSADKNGDWVVKNPADSTSKTAQDDPGDAGAPPPAPLPVPALVIPPAATEAPPTATPAG